MSQAQVFELNLQAVKDEDLQSVGASIDESGVWTFPDASRGRILQRPVPVYDDKMTKLGLSWFDTIE